VVQGNEHSSNVASNSGNGKPRRALQTETILTVSWLDM
jgi:hypothetical protein